MKIFKKMKKGFTLVELVVVIAVIAILAAVSVGAYFGVTESANNSRLEQEAKQVYTAIQTVALAPNEHSSLTSSGLIIKDVAKFEKALEDNLGIDVALPDEPNTKDPSKPTIYFVDPSINHAIGGSAVYSSFEYYSHTIGGKRAVTNVITGEAEVVSKTDSSANILDNDKEKAEATVIISEYATSNSWVNATQYPTVNLNEKVFVTVFGTNDTGKYYSNGNNWRIYQGENPEIKVHGDYDVLINSVTFKYTVANNGVLTYNGSNISSEEEVVIDNTQGIFSVGNTGNTNNGQVRISEITVKYSIDKTAEEPAPTPIITSISEALTAERGREVELTGTVDDINIPWNDATSCISYYLKDTNGDTILVYKSSTNVVLGDIVKVTGVVGSYNGTNQVAEGSTAIISGHDDTYDEIEYVESISEALESPDGTNVRLQGEVIEIRTPYSATNNNISVVISDGTNSILVYRLIGNTKLHQVIKVTGEMYTYNEDTKEVKNGTFEVIEEEKECYDFYDATCTEPKTCKICSKPSGEALGHAEADSNGLCTRCHLNIAYKTATLSFSDISNRTTFTNEQQIWQENGITVVNNKHEYTNNIGDYSNPARFYKSTELIIQHEKNIIEIEVNANSSDYATALKDSIGNIATVLLDDKNVNITLETPCVELKFVVSAQIRIDSLKLVYDDLSEPIQPPHNHIWNNNGTCSGCDAICNHENYIEKNSTSSKCETCGYIHTHSLNTGEICEECGYEMPQGETLIDYSYSHNFSKGDLKTTAGEVTLNNRTWIQSECTYIGWDTNTTEKGIQIGSGSSPQKENPFTLETIVSDVKYIKSISFETSVASKGGLNYVIYVDGTSVKTGSTSSTSKTTITHTFNTPVEGSTIKISIQSTESKAMYLSKIAFDYQA